MKFIEKTKWGDVLVETTEDGPMSKTYPSNHPYSLITNAFDKTPFNFYEYPTEEDLAWLVAKVVSLDHLTQEELEKRIILEIGYIAHLEEWHNECTSKVNRKKMRKFYKKCDEEELILDAEMLEKTLSDEPIPEEEIKQEIKVE